MQGLRAIAATLLFSIVAGRHEDVATARVTPVEQVLTLLKDMHKSGLDAMHAEEVQYTAYAYFCQDVIPKTEETIAHKDGIIQGLEADIEKAAATAEQLQLEMDEHEDYIKNSKNEAGTATMDRKTEHAVYLENRANFTESITAIENAIKTLKAEDYSRTQAATTTAAPTSSSLRQLEVVRNLAHVSADVTNALDLYISRVESTPTAAPGEAYGYEFQSVHVIEMLEGILVDFKNKLAELESQESKNKRDYDRLVVVYGTEIGMNATQMDAKTSSKNSQEMSKLENKKLLNETQASKETDEEYVAELKATCAEKKVAFERRQAVRADELKAILQAIEIISSSGVQGHAETYLPSALQQAASGAGALASLRMSVSQVGNRLKVHEFLMQQANRLKSTALSTLASEIMSGDPFAKVKDLIQKLIIRLEGEAMSEKTSKQYCDARLSSNSEKRAQCEDDIDRLTLQANHLNASIIDLTNQIGDLTDEVSAIESEVAYETELRANESAINGQTKNDAEEAMALVEKTVGILRDFYNNPAGESFVQGREHPKAPEIFGDEEYAGMQDESTGIFALLDVIASDFTRLKETTEKDEIKAHLAHTQFLTDSAATKGAKELERSQLMDEKSTKRNLLTETEQSLESTQMMLDAANKEYEALKPTCLLPPTTYEDRVKRREEEIQSLQEALRILQP